MALEISYFQRADGATGKCYGPVLGSASVTLGGTSADLGALPAGAQVARLKAGEACRVSNNAGAASATNGIYLGAGDVVDLEVTLGIQLKGLTA